MKILLVTDDMLPGGVARHVVDLANGLCEKGMSVTVAATEGRFQQLLCSAVTFESLDLLKKDSFRKNIVGIIPSYFKLKKLIKKNRFDIIHSHKRFSHLLVSLIPKANAKHITSYHSVFPGKKLFSVLGDYTVCCSKAVAEQVIHTYNNSPSRTAIIYNGIAPLKKHSEIQCMKTRKQLGISNETRVVSSVGQFLPSKDRETLIYTIKLLNKAQKINNVVFVLLGYGHLQTKLEQLVKSLHLEEHVKFVGSDVSVEALFNISEFMVLNPKHSEGFGIVMLEAASLGKVHIGTTVGGIPEFIDHNQTGLLVPPENPHALANAIEFLLNNPQENLRMGKNAKKKFEESFMLDNMITNMLDVYGTLV